MTSGTPSRPAVMADVAAQAGVSVMTVSRVLNGFTGVTDETRQRVEEAVTSLGYHANTAARVLAGGSSRTLGVMAVETEQFGPSRMLFGIEAAAREAGHALSFVTLSRSGNDMASTLHRLRASHVQGVIVVAPVRRVVEAATQIDGDLPLVVVGGDPAIGAPTVTIDQVEGARLATRHLLDLGHRMVHHVTGPQTWIDATARMRGWSDAHRTYPAQRGRSVAGDWTARRGYEAGQRLARDADVTAVFAANDQTALGVIRGLHDAGRRVPEDVSVVGFDDTPESGFFLPPLTTIRQDFDEVGRRSVELLLSLADGDPVDRHVVVPAELVVRESTAPPP
ncbi:MAG: LacI family DNA-binding transcriptional regulator [Acidimicrobiales bacterium]